jgi:hypothetical protein
MTVVIHMDETKHDWQFLAGGIVAILSARSILEDQLTADSADRSA